MPAEPPAHPALAARQRDMRLFFAGIVLYSQAVADRLGIGASDLQCLNVLALAGPVTAGQLASLTGLSTGAVTRLVDRLENAGLVSRDRDPDDRRRVIVKPGEQGTEEVAPLFSALGRRMGAILAELSPVERDAVLAFVHRSHTVLREETEAVIAGRRTPKRRPTLDR